MTLSWTAPIAGSPTSYVIEASSTPGGPANLANFNTGNAQTTLVTAGVPVGTYYVRVRGLDASGLGPASNEIQLSVGGVALSAPVLNNNQPVLTSGSTVTLSWTAPAAGLPISYVIEASSTPGGPANLANFNTGNVQTALVVPNVPAGTYYVRVRGVDASGPGAPSNEIQLVVGNVGGVCPSAPRGLNIVSQSGGAVTLAWLPPLTGAPTSYVVQAGSVPGAANLANVDTNSTALSLAATVPAGSYFVRVYARSSACASSTFLGPASNEILLSVGGVPGWGGQIECRIAITGPSGYRHDETQTWFVSRTRAGDQQRWYQLPCRVVGARLWRWCWLELDHRLDGHDRSLGHEGGVDRDPDLRSHDDADPDPPGHRRLAGLLRSARDRFSDHRRRFRQRHVGDRHVEPPDRRRRFAAATGRFGRHPVLYVVTQVPVKME